jgi:outer membrane protein assembly factor BamD
MMHGRVQRWQWILLAIVAVGLAEGCVQDRSIVPAGLLEADKYLFERGNELIARRKFIQAREFYRQLVDNYPQSPLRPDAKLGLGDTYLGEGTAESVVLAENEYREFLTFYPTNTRADYAQFKLGLCHFEQMLSPDRDQTETREALAELTTFVKRYPNSRLLPEGNEKLRIVRTRLSDADYGVGYFYYRSRWYPGAIERFRSVLKDDPEYPTRDALYYYLAQSYMVIGRPAEAAPYFDKVTSEFEKSQFLVLAKNGLADAKAKMAAAQNPAPAVPKKK